MTEAKELGFALEYFNHGLGRDTIAALIDPQFISSNDESITDYIDDEDEIISINHEGIARAYTIEMLVSHEAINDQIGDLHFTAAYCPLADLGIIYNRELSTNNDKQIVTIGVSGWTYKSTFVLYDKETLSLWYPYWNGLRAISGDLHNAKLRIIPHLRTTWKNWKSKYPNAELCIAGTMISSITSTNH